MISQCNRVIVAILCFTFHILEIEVSRYSRILKKAKWRLRAKYLLVDLPFVRILIDGHRSIDAGPGIAIPMPNAPKLLSSLIHFDLQAQLISQTPQQVNATEAGSDDQHIACKAILICVTLAAHVRVRSTDVSAQSGHLYGSNKLIFQENNEKEMMEKIKHDSMIL